KEQVETMNIQAGAYVDMDPGERPWNRHAVFNVSGRHKLSMTADLRRPEGVEIFKKLVAISDVVMENNSFGTMSKLGLGYEDLRKVNPQIIMISMPLFGNTGPYKEILGTGAGVDVFS